MFLQCISFELNRNSELDIAWEVRSGSSSIDPLQLDEAL
jgi:hypothetical protein